MIGAPAKLLSLFCVTHFQAIFPQIVVESSQYPVVRYLWRLHHPRRHPIGAPPFHRMAFCSFIGTVSSRFHQTSRFSSTASPYCDLLLQAKKTSIRRNLERDLSRVLTNSGSNMHHAIVQSVLRINISSSPVTDLLPIFRFFIWAGLQPSYRHSRAAYGMACDMLNLSRYPDTVEQLLDHYKEDGAFVTVKAFRILLDLCRQAGLPQQALLVLRRMAEFDCQPDTSSYNAVLQSLLNDGGALGVETASMLFQEMVLSGICPNMASYVSMVKGLCEADRFEEARTLVSQMHVHGCKPNVVVYSALLDGACRCGNVEAAMKLLEQMEQEPDEELAANVVTYTSLIQCFCDGGRVKEATEVLNRMMGKGCFPNGVTISIFLKALWGTGQTEEALKLIERVVASSIVTEKECYSSLLLCMLNADNISEAEKLISMMLTKGLRPGGLALNSFLRQYCSRGRFLEGFNWANELLKRGLSLDSDVYSSLLLGLCQGNHLKETVLVFKWAFERKVCGEPCFDMVIKLLNESGKSALASKIMDYKRNMKL